MSDKHQPTPDSDQSNIYQIRIKESLSQEWQAWFDGMSTEQDVNGNTILTGYIEDQAQLFGLLKKVRNLGLTLLSVTPINLTDN